MYLCKRKMVDGKLLRIQTKTTVVEVWCGLTGLSVITRVLKNMYYMLYLGHLLTLHTAKSLATVKVVTSLSNIFKTYSNYHISISLYFELHRHVS